MKFKPGDKVVFVGSKFTDHPNDQIRTKVFTISYCHGPSSLPYTLLEHRGCYGAQHLELVERKSLTHLPDFL